MVDPAGARRVVDPSGKAGYELVFEDTFDGDTLERTRWLPYYLPQWSSREASAARYELGGGVLRLVIEADQQPWCPEFDGQTRVSSLQTGVFAGPVGRRRGSRASSQGWSSGRPRTTPGSTRPGTACSSCARRRSTIPAAWSRCG